MEKLENPGENVKLALLVFAAGIVSHAATINYSSDSDSGTTHGASYVFTGSSGSVTTIPGTVSFFTVGTLELTFSDPLPIDFAFGTTWTRDGFTEPLMFDVSIIDFAGGYFLALPHFTNPDPLVKFGIKSIPNGLADGTEQPIFFEAHDVPEPSLGFFGVGLFTAGLLLRRRAT